MVPPDPMTPQHFHLIEKLLEYFAVFVTGGGVTLGGHHVVKRRRNGKTNGEATLDDVVKAIMNSGEKTRKTIYETSEKSRQEFSALFEKQMEVCHKNEMRAVRVLDALGKGDPQ